MSIRPKLHHFYITRNSHVAYIDQFIDGKYYYDHLGRRYDENGISPNHKFDLMREATDEEIVIFHDTRGDTMFRDAVKAEVDKNSQTYLKIGIAIVLIGPLLLYAAYRTVKTQSV